jgi:hypothetical protein
MPNKGCIIRRSSISTRQLAIALAITLGSCGLCGCGSINEKLSAGMGDAIPQWAGGLPADAPPRPGSAKYDEFMLERERKRLEPAAASDDAAPQDLQVTHVR